MPAFGMSAEQARTAEQNRQVVTEAFGHFMRGDARPFFSLVADDVRWTVIGSTAISGTFDSKKAFVADATSKLSGRLATPISGTINSVLADGDHVIVQWEGRADMANGGLYDQRYCWVMRLADGKVVETVAYLDTEMVSAVFGD
jgi:ketosteroid isomerase-like protein